MYSLRDLHLRCGHAHSMRWGASRRGRCAEYISACELCLTGCCGGGGGGGGVFGGGGGGEGPGGGGVVKKK